MVLDPTLIGNQVFACFQKFEQDLAKGALISYDLQKARVRRLPFD
jgi:hypothetical protein